MKISSYLENDLKTLSKGPHDQIQGQLRAPIMRKAHSNKVGPRFNQELNTQINSSEDNQGQMQASDC